MRVGNIIKSNEKGQIVIPRKMRETLGINKNVPLNLVLRGDGIYIYPVEEVLSFAERETSYAKVLKKTQGSWGGDSWEQTRKGRKKIEVTSSKERKKAW